MEILKVENLTKIYGKEEAKVVGFEMETYGFDCN